MSIYDDVRNYRKGYLAALDDAEEILMDKTLVEWRSPTIYGCVREVLYGISGKRKMTMESMEEERERNNEQLICINETKMERNGQ